MSDILRRRGCAVALLTAPGLALAGHLVQATPDAHDTASELASIAAAPGRAEAAGAIGFLMLLLIVPAFFGLAQPLWERRPRLALVGVSLGIAGVLGLTALMGSAPVTVAMADAAADRAEMVALTNRYESAPIVGVWIVLLMLGYTLMPVVLGFALWRTGWTVLVPVALVVGLVLTMADAGRWPLAAGFAATWVGLGIVGVGLWREPMPTGDDAASARKRVRA